MPIYIDQKKQFQGGDFIVVLHCSKSCWIAKFYSVMLMIHMFTLDIGFQEKNADFISSMQIHFKILNHLIGQRYLRSITQKHLSLILPCVAYCGGEKNKNIGTSEQRETGSYSSCSSMTRDSERNDRG